MHLVKEFPELRGVWALEQLLIVEGGGVLGGVGATTGDGGEGPGGAEVDDEGQGLRAPVPTKETLQVEARLIPTPHPQQALHVVGVEEEARRLTHPSSSNQIHHPLERHESNPI